MSDEEPTWRVEIIDIPTRELAEQVAAQMEYLTHVPSSRSDLTRIRIRLMRVSPEPTIAERVDASLADDKKAN